ncbi:MAG: EexN family lipoprotein [Burkholderia sp.]
MKKILVTALVLALAACGKKVQTVSDVKTVDWYLANQDVMQKVLGECNNNPGELSADQNCINASTAKAKTVWQQEGTGAIPTMRQNVR